MVRALRCRLDIPPYPHHPFPPLNRCGKGGITLTGSCSGSGGDVVGPLAYAAARQHPECPFSAGGGSSRPSREIPGAPPSSGVVPCGGGLSPLYGGLDSPVRRFGFPCTEVWFSLYGQTRRPTRGMRSPYTEGLNSLHGGFEFPTRSKRPCRTF